MSTLERQVMRARRRLNTNILAERTAFAVLVATGLWTLALLVERAFVLNLPVWHGVWLAAVLAAALALVRFYVKRVSALEAAVAIDAAAGLKERISTALAVRGVADPFARLAVRDAEQRAGGVHVPTHLPYRAPSLWPWTTAGLLAAVILGLFLPPLNLLAGQSNADSAAQRQQAEVEQRAINAELETYRDRIREMAQDHPGLKDLAEELQPLELPDEPTVTPEDIRREAAQRIDKVADRLTNEKEAANMDALQETRRLLSQLEPQAGQDATSRLSQSLAQGDFEGARKALEDLEKQLDEAANQGDAQAAQKRQQMQRQLKRLADQLAQMDDATYLRKELENKAGLSEEEARKLLEKLSKMDPKQLAKELQRQLGQQGLSQKQIKEMVKKFQQKQQANQSCQQLGQCMSQLSQALQQVGSPAGGSGSAQAAAGALADAMGQLSDLEMSEQLLDELEAQLAELGDLRDSVCQGDYCPGACRGGPGQRRIGSQGPNYGLGMGSRVPRERAAHALQPSKVKSRMQGGTIIGQMLVDGPQVRGQATAEVREALNAAQRDALDAIERDEVPRQYHTAVQQYFERLAGLIHQGEKPDSPEDDPTKNESESGGE